MLAGLAAGAAAGLLGGRAGAAADASGAVVEAVPRGDLLALGDGSLVRLAGIVVPGPRSGHDAARALAGEARSLLEDLAAGRAPALSGGQRDRHGHRLALASLGGAGSLQETLLGRGLGWAWPEGVEAGVFERLLAAEAGAEAAGAGLWGIEALRPQEAHRVRAGTPRFALVAGTVLETARQRRYVYLNFGADWRHDFTARVPLARARPMSRAGLDPLELGGRRVRVRGWLVSANGPMIEVSRREQIEELP